MHGMERRNDCWLFPVSTDGQTLYAQQAALGDTEVVDVFAPAREDFLAGGTPSYMRAP